MPIHVDKEPDQGRIVAALAREFQRSIDEVGLLYEHERASLAAEAHVTAFLHIFAVRSVREILHRR
jgi:hypothetical protein